MIFYFQNKKKKMEILNKYLEYLNARKQSKNYYNIIKIWLDWLDTKKIDYLSITQSDITNFFVEHSDYSISTRNQFIKAGRDFYKFLNIENNEWEKIKLLKAERKIPNYLTEQELEKIISCAITFSKHFSINKIKALLYFMFYSGIRKTELLNLKRENFNLAEGIAKVYGKGRKERYVYYPQKVAKIINEYFLSEEEKINAFNITLGQLNNLFNTMSKNAGRKIHPHLFRHSGARDMIAKGVPISIVSKILGHTNISTTMIYVSADDEMVKNIYKQKMNIKKEKI